MNKDHISGEYKNVKGKIREEIGHATGNDKQTLKGMAEQVAGKVQKGFADAKDAVKETVDSFLHPKDKKVS